MEVAEEPAGDIMAGSSKDTTMVAAANGSKCVFLDHNSSLKKSKRKRTSAQDHDLLEAFYLKDSKPDKAERAAIVAKVELNEKEVQIWFQNRRQNDRRRSKPLEHHEIEVHVNKSGNTLSSSEELTAPTPSPISEISPAFPTTNGDHNGVSAKLPPIADTTHNAGPSDQTAGEASTPPTVVVDLSNESSSPGSARKRDHAEMATDNNTAVKKEDITSQDAPQVKAKKPLKRASSMRLAMTADGSVKIKTSNSPTPSPEKARVLPLSVDSIKRTKLTRSVSMFEDGQTFHDPATSTKISAGKSNFGRSRDARTWEFYCDSGSKDDLATQAEAQRKGSAVGAINRLRAASNKARAPLSPSTTKVYQMPSKSTKPKIARAQSSLPRLEADASLGKQQVAGNGRRRRSGCGPPVDDDDGNDSDKENWRPGTRQWRHQLRNGGDFLEPYVPFVGEAPIESPRVPVPARRVVASPDRPVRGYSPMTTSRTRTAELDVVQSLLSLRHGSMR